MSHWIFIRHGESVANKARVFSGHQDVPLTELGKEQAAAAGEWLSKGPLPTHVYSSDLQRAVKTAELVLTHAGVDAPIQQSPMLRERHLGAWQGQPIDKLKAEGARAILHSWTGKAPGGESLAELAHRSVSFFATQPDHEVTLVAGHGGLIRVLVGLIDHQTFDEIGKVNIPNAVPMTRQVSPEAWAAILSRLDD